MVMIWVQCCVVKDGCWIQRATLSYFSWPPCVPGPVALPATQIAEWYVHKDLCNKTTRSQESTDWRLEGADFQRVVENCGNGSGSAAASMQWTRRRGAHEMRAESLLVEQTADTHSLSRREAALLPPQLNIVDSEERGPTAGVAGSGLSGIAGRGASAAGVRMAGSTA